MEKLKKHIHDDSNGLDYVLVGDYYIPDLQLTAAGGKPPNRTVGTDAQGISARVLSRPVQ